MYKVWKCDLGEEWIATLQRGEIHGLKEGQERENHTGECIRRTFPQSQSLRIWKVLNFVSTYNQHGLKPKALKVCVLGWDKA